MDDILLPPDITFDPDTAAEQVLDDIGEAVSFNPKKNFIKLFQEKPWLAQLKAEFEDPVSDQALVSALFDPGNIKRPVSHIADDMQANRARIIQDRVAPKIAAIADAAMPTAPADAAADDMMADEQFTGTSRAPRVGSAEWANQFRQDNPEMIQQIGRAFSGDPNRTPSVAMAPVADDDETSTANRVRSGQSSPGLALLTSHALTMDQAIEAVTTLDMTELNDLYNDAREFVLSRPNQPERAELKAPNAAQMVLSGLLAAVGGSPADAARALAMPLQLQLVEQQRQQARNDAEFQAMQRQTDQVVQTFENEAKKIFDGMIKQSEQRVKGILERGETLKALTAEETKRVNAELAAVSREEIASLNARTRVAIESIRGDQAIREALAKNPAAVAGVTYARLIEMGVKEEQARAIALSPLLKATLENELVSARINQVNTEAAATRVRAEADMVRAMSGGSTSSRRSGNTVYSSDQEQAARNQVSTLRSRQSQAESIVKTLRDDYNAITKRITEKQSDLRKARAKDQSLDTNAAEVQSLERELEQLKRDQASSARRLREEQVVLNSANQAVQNAEDQLQQMLNANAGQGAPSQEPQPTAPAPTVSPNTFFSPIEGGGRISSRFGMRRHPVHGDQRMHSGVDIAAPGGTPIRASASGRVIFSGVQGGYGNMVIIDHGNGVTTRYAHQNGRSMPRVGTQVTRGQVIGQVGTTGTSTGNHLHYEVRRNGSAIDPMGAEAKRLIASLS